MTKLRITKEKIKQYRNMAVVFFLAAIGAYTAINANSIWSGISPILENEYAGMLALSLILVCLYLILKRDQESRGSLIVAGGTPENIIKEKNWYVTDKAIRDDLSKSVEALIISPSQSTHGGSLIQPYASKVHPNVKAVMIRVAAGLNSIKAAMSQRMSEIQAFEQARQMLSRNYISKFILVGHGITGSSALKAWRLMATPNATFNALFVVGDIELDVTPAEEVPAHTVISTILPAGYSSMMLKTDVKASPEIQRVAKAKNLKEEKWEFFEWLAESAILNNSPFILSLNDGGYDNIVKKEVLFVTAQACSQSINGKKVIELEQESGISICEPSHWGRYPSPCAHTDAFTIYSEHNILSIINDLEQLHERKLKVSVPFLNYNIPIQHRDPLIMVGVGNSDLLERARSAIADIQGKDLIAIFKSVPKAEEAKIVLYIPLLTGELMNSSYKMIHQGWMSGLEKKKQMGGKP